MSGAAVDYARVRVKFGDSMLNGVRHIQGTGFVLNEHVEVHPNIVKL